MTNHQKLHNYLETLTVADLRLLCHVSDIEAYLTLNRDDLIDALDKL